MSELVNAPLTEESNVQSKNRYVLWVVVMVLLGGATLPLGGQQAKIPPVPVPNISGPIPVTADSHPFNASAFAQVVIDLPKAGYVEEEFIINGKANVYSRAADNTIKIKTPDAPYATRILVRRPKDNARFSGTVLVEWFFEERPYDVDSMWGFFHEGLLARGDAWVGVTLKPQVIATLKKFDPKRYGTLSMKNPLPLSQTCTDPKIYTEPGNLGDSPETEKGLSWDMLSQAGAAMKSGKLGFKAERLYLTGMAEGEAITYGAVISRIAFLENGKTIFDGSIPKDNAVSTRLNQCDPQIPRGDPRTVVGPRPIPMIRLITEPFALNGTARRPDSDDPNDRFRLYEIAGANHVALAPYIYLPPIADYQKAGVMPIQAS